MFQRGVIGGLNQAEIVARLHAGCFRNSVVGETASFERVQAVKALKLAVVVVVRW